MLPGMLPRDSAKATIDAAWCLLTDDTITQLLAIVQEAVRKHGGE